MKAKKVQDKIVKKFYICKFNSFYPHLFDNFSKLVVVNLEVLVASSLMLIQFPHINICVYEN